MEVGAYYNENDAFAGEWLNNLSGAGHIAEGFVDTRSIELLDGTDVKDVTQAHFFAGVGVWSHALRAAGWPDDAPVWTGSCPCQPFSVAGRGKGKDDARHLWPVWLELIKQCSPPVIFGEQVASPAGRAWLASISADLEALGYLVVAADLCAAGVGAPHLRQRLFFGAVQAGLVHSFGDGSRGDGRAVPCEEGEGTGRGKIPGGFVDGVEPTGAVSSVADADDMQRHRGRDAGPGGGFKPPDRRGEGFWSDAEWVECLDGKARPAKPGVFPLAHGPTQRMGRLRAYGNAIVPQVAAAFVSSFSEAIGWK